MPLLLVVHLTEQDRTNLEGGGVYSAQDKQYPKDVGDFCHANNFLYSPHFVAIAVYADEIGAGSLGRVYGPVVAVLRNEIVVPDIVLTCDGDLQDVARNGMYHIHKNRNASKYISSVYIPSGSPTARTQQIFSRAKEYPGKPYTEARILRSLTSNDIDHFA